MHINQQERFPDQVIVADGAVEPGVEPLIIDLKKVLKYPILYYRCTHQGAAMQRNEASELVTQDVILFIDDDLYMESDCLVQIMKVLEEDVNGEIGGVAGILTNQHYREPSRLFKMWLDFMAGEKAASYAGRVIGPAINIWPAPGVDGKVVEVEWLISGCTAYRIEAFREELFSPLFYGYSMGEDVHLSLRIGKRLKLVVATAAKAFHDSQPSRFKRPFQIGKMGVGNRYMIMTEVMGRNNIVFQLKFLLSVLFSLATSARNVRSIKDLWNYILVCLGHMGGLLKIATGRLKSLMSSR